MKTPGASRGRKDIEILGQDVALRADHVRRIDEQDVVGGQCLEQRARHRLDPVTHHRKAIEPVEPGHFVRFNANVLAAVTGILAPVHLDRAASHERRHAAADLDHPGRTEMPDHAIQKFGVSGAEIRIVVAEVGLAAGLHGNRPEFVLEVELREQVQLFLVVHTDARQRARCVEPAMQMPRVEQRFVVVVPHREHADLAQ